MKKSIYLFIITVAMLLSQSVVPVVNAEPLNMMQIDSTDTVVFDLSNATIIGTKLNFPVLTLTDDTIYALDFSIKYNVLNMNYDSLIEHTNYMQSFYYFNSNDSTFRFTSYSIQPYTNDTDLVSVQFNLFSLPITITDFYEIKAYLNGSECSIKIINPQVTSINTSELKESVLAYPNPVSNLLNIEVTEKSSIQLVNLNGIIISQNDVEIPESASIDMGRLVSGVYLLKVTTSKNIIYKKIVKR